MSVRLLVLVGISFACLAKGTLAQTCEFQKLIASDSEIEKRFGTSVSMSGDVAIVGAYQDDDNGHHSGAAYIFRFNGATWVEEQKIVASDGAVEDYFGVSVGISGDVAIVGAYFDDDNGNFSGSAYVFRFNGSQWVEDAKLLAADGAAQDLFGWSVSISGDNAIVGAYRDSDNGSWSGAAYIFRFDGSDWEQVQKLLASDGVQGDNFGWAVSINGTAALIGAPQADFGLTGTAYVFRFNGKSWIEEQRLVAPVGVPGDNFGLAVSISGATLVVGAPQTFIQGQGIPGSAHVFRHNGLAWVYEQRLVPSDPDASQIDRRFGRSVAIDRHTVIVGAHDDNDLGQKAGAAYLFQWDGTVWNEVQKLLASDGGVLDNAGYTVSLSGKFACVGAWIHDDVDVDSGASYIYGIPVIDCNENGIADVCDISTGLSCDRNNNTIPDECESYCAADLTCNSVVNVDDLLLLIGLWGSGVSIADLNLDETVNVDDLLILIGAWGPCP